MVGASRSADDANSGVLNSLQLAEIKFMADVPSSTELQ